MDYYPDGLLDAARDEMSDEARGAARHYAAQMAEAEAAQAAHIAAEDARIAGTLVQVGPYTYADPTCRQCHGTGVVSDTVDYGSTTTQLDSPCECQVDYLWAVTDGDGITLEKDGRTHEGDHLGGMYFYNKRELGGGVIVQQRTFPTPAALLEACATIAPLSAWAVVWDDQGADDAPRY